MPELGEVGSPEIPGVEQCVLGAVLERRAREHPERTYAVFADGTRWSYARAWDAAERAACGLRGLGVDRGDRVLVWAGNGPELLATWFGSNLLGAVFTPLNTAYRGSLLRHAIELSGARVLVAEASLTARLERDGLGRLEHIVVLDEGTGAAAVAELAHDLHLLLGPRVHDSGLLAGEVRDRAWPRVRPWDTQAVVFTSGTTGPSKAVLCSYVQQYTTISAGFGGHLSAEDRYLVNLPLFHAAGTLASYAMLLVGGSIAVTGRFDTNDFLRTVRRFDVTTCTLLGAMVNFLTGRPPSTEDKRHRLRTVCVIPLQSEAFEFQQRYGVPTVYTVYNMTEISAPLVSRDNPDRAGLCGRPRPGVEVRLVDPDDVEVAPGEVGELIVRTNRPWSMSHGYLGMPEATAAAWRNGWFHTGDCFRVDEAGDFSFVDRRKDAIRRRGENISSFEVECALGEHGAIREAAVVGVPSEHGEEEVLALVEPVTGASVDEAELIEFLRPRLPHFMIPRYLRVVGELPRTPTNKVRKDVLRARGLDPGAWDREAAGITVKRDRVS
ncbi:AMP-binding protein [Amycolatopsis anabasis]|uniref:AMP-binding protein n=1 Tax=Amycolatopsis anabasis TaxID=1840409 RepID=UPI00131D8208|nr:AMP-binding protein [Amycolatopsis anabasis]